MKYGLVLAGGGARGAYQIGVMRAIRELGIEISAVCGTSIGAINGALFAQGSYEKACEMWRDIRLENIIKSKCRTEAGMTVPPHGLYLYDVYY